MKNLRLACVFPLVLGVAAAALLGHGTDARAQGFQPRMGEPLQTLSAAELVRFLKGKQEFSAILTPAQGLGPIFNDNSCGECHSGPAPGGAGTTTVTRFGKQASGPNPFDPLASLGGSLLQDEALSVPCLEAIPPQADVTALRITPHTFGAGLLEAIVDADILAYESNPPDPAVSGFARIVQPVEGGAARPARFGWKGGVATVLTFSADASLNEMGLTNQFFLAENAPNGDLGLLAACDTVPEPEDVPDIDGVFRIERQTDFQVLLAPPPQTPRSGMSGELVFTAAGCAACHVSASYVTGPSVHSPALAGVAIRPYSDFLLHDMGTLGDGIVDGVATEDEMMTRALWGVAQRVSLLHDGSATAGTFAEIVDDAIQQHDGEASFSRTAYNFLSPSQKDQLVAFLRSLGRSEFDWDLNNQIDVFDWFFLEPFLTGPAPSFTPDHPAALADADQDNDFDLEDFGILQRAFTGQ